MKNATLTYAIKGVLEEMLLKSTLVSYSVEETASGDAIDVKLTLPDRRDDGLRDDTLPDCIDAIEALNGDLSTWTIVEGEPKRRHGDMIVTVSLTNIAKASVTPPPTSDGQTPYQAHWELIEAYLPNYDTSSRVGLTDLMIRALDDELDDIEDKCFIVEHYKSRKSLIRAWIDAEVSMTRDALRAYAEEKWGSAKAE